MSKNSRSFPGWVQNCSQDSPKLFVLVVFVSLIGSGSRSTGSREMPSKCPGLLLPRCGLCSPCQCPICEELLPSFAFLLTSKALYSRCLADCIKALERVRKYARISLEYLEVFVLTVRRSTCDCCVDVGRLDIGRLIVLTQGMMTLETQIWTSAKATALDHVRDFLVAPVFDKIEDLVIVINSARVHLNNLCHNLMLSRYRLRPRMKARKAESSLREVISFFETQVKIDYWGYGCYDYDDW